MKRALLISLTAILFVRAASADVCKIDVSASDQMRFDHQVLRIDSGCGEVEVNFTNTGKQPAKIMGHNWVLTRTKDLAPVAIAGMGAGFANNYQVPGDSRIIAATKLIGGGESTSVKFSVAALKAGDEYSFFCSSPGHYSIMKGRFEIAVGNSLANAQAANATR